MRAARVKCGAGERTARVLDGSFFHSRVLGFRVLREICRHRAVTDAVLCTLQEVKARINGSLHKEGKLEKSWIWEILDHFDWISSNF